MTASKIAQMIQDTEGKEHKASRFINQPDDEGRSALQSRRAQQIVLVFCFQFERMSEHLNGHQSNRPE